MKKNVLLELWKPPTLDGATWLETNASGTLKAASLGETTCLKRASGTFETANLGGTIWLKSVPARLLKAKGAPPRPATGSAGEVQCPEPSQPTGRNDSVHPGRFVDQCGF